MDEPRIVDVTGASTGRYELLEERDDSIAVLSPDTSIASIRQRLDTQPVSPEEFQRLFGDLPTGPA